MASLKEIRGRIASIRNIAQITRAMELVAASRMKRAQEAILAARPYDEELRSALSRVTAAIGEEVDPMLARVRCTAPGPDRDDHRPRPGGALDTNTVRAALRHIAGAGGRAYWRRPGGGLRHHRRAQGPRPAASRRHPHRRALPAAWRPAGFADVTPIARLVSEDFLDGTYDEIAVVYPGFVSTLTQRANVTDPAAGAAPGRLPRRGG